MPASASLEKKDLPQRRWSIYNFFGVLVLQPLNLHHVLQYSYFTWVCVVIIFEGKVFRTWVDVLRSLELRFVDARSVRRAHAWRWAKVTESLGQGRRDASFGAYSWAMVCRDSATWEIFILFTIWTKYNSMRGGKKERTDSFESEPLDKRSLSSLPRLSLRPIHEPRRRRPLLFFLDHPSS